MSNNLQKIKLFVSYSHDNEPYFKVFSDGFKKVVINSQNFDWNIWDDTKILPGNFWDDEIQNNIQDCNIALLLVSVEFMASKYIKEKEFAEFSKRYADKGILIFPIVFAPCDFNKWEDLGKLQFFKPKGSDFGKPEIPNFTYADLIQHNQQNGTLIPNANISRYHLELFSKIEASYQNFLSKKKTNESINIVSTPEIGITYSNNLNEFPRPKQYFTGRDSEIEEFKSAIDNGITLIAIDGAGGIGKTQFVSRCIEKFIPQDKIIWFNCNIASQVDTLISEAGYPEFIKGTSKTDREKFSAFKDKIQEDELFLFLDNFHNTNGNPLFMELLIFMQEYLHKGCIIVIDRDNIVNIDLKPKRIHIEGFKEKRLEYAKALIEHSFRNDITIEDEELENLCNELQGYPLAIDFAILLLSQGETPTNIINKIVNDGDVEKISNRLLNAIFSREDATQEEKDFISQFSVFTGTVSEQAIKAVIVDNLVAIAPKKLHRKNLISITNGIYEIHPLVREFCYKELVDKETIHIKVANYYIQQRENERLNPSLEEQIFYHLAKAGQWGRIETEIEENGRQFILLGQIGLLKELLENLTNIGINKPLFNIFFGDIAQIQGHWDIAIEFFNSAILIEDDKHIKAEGIIKYGEILYRKGMAKEALPFFEQAYDFCKKNNLQKEEARAINDIGLVYDWFGNLEEALKKMSEALIIRRSLNDKDGIAATLINTALIYKAKDRKNEALKMFQESFEIALDMNTKATCLNGIGSIYQMKGSHMKALAEFEKSLNISQKSGNKSSIASSLNNIGISLEANGTDEALDKHNESKKISQEIGSKDGVASSYYNIGVFYLEKNEFDKALENLNKSNEIFEEISYAIGKIKTNYMIGITYANDIKKNYYNALFNFFKSLSQANKIGLKSIDTINWIIALRDRKIGLEKFKILAKQAYVKLDNEMQQFIPLKELLKEPIKHLELPIGRNDPCTCGSGKKYKQCHGKS